MFILFLYLFIHLYIAVKHRQCSFAKIPFWDGGGERCPNSPIAGEKWCDLTLACDSQIISNQKPINRIPRKTLILALTLDEAHHESVSY